MPYIHGLEDSILLGEQHRLIYRFLTLPMKILAEFFVQTGNLVTEVQILCSCISKNVQKRRTY